jgi:hypothetical protein
MVASGAPAAQIAEALNDANLRTYSGRRWTKLAVQNYCYNHGVRWPHRMPSTTVQPERRSDGAYSRRGVARCLRVTEGTVRYWIERGWLTSVERAGRGRPQWFQLDPAALARLKRVRAAHYRPRPSRPLTSRRAKERRSRHRAFSNRMP